MKRFSEEQIIGFLKQAEAGVPVKALLATRLRDASFYNWRAKFGGMSARSAGGLAEQVDKAVNQCG